MQKNQIAFQEAHRLIEYFELSFDFLETLLLFDLNLPSIFDKIKRSYSTINYSNTL